MPTNLIDQIAFVAAIGLPLFNIPLIAKVVRRKSSADISLTWVLGVWLCIVMMAPSGFRSDDVVWRTFNYFNVIMFTGVAAVAVRYRKGRA